MAFITNFINLKYSSDSITHQQLFDKAKNANISLEYQGEVDLEKSRHPLNNKPTQIRLKFMPGYLGKWLEIRNVIPNNDRRLYVDQSLENGV